MMNLYLSRGDRLRFPVPTNDIREGIIRKSVESAMIIATDSPVPNLAKYIQRADLTSEEDLRALNAIAERTDAMTEAEANIFSGALDAESVNSLDVTLATPMHPFLPEERNVRQREDGSFYNLEYARPITIERNCWLASNVVVCGGVTIGEGSVIGAGSVVTRDIPPHSLAAGIPCRVIRKITDKDSMRDVTRFTP